jgi:hypothetical protein
MNAPSAGDRSILRELVRQYADASALDVHRQTHEQWRRLNRLDSVRPMVWINEIPWDEMSYGDELTCLCVDPYCRSVESELRMTLYQWRHMPADMVLDPVLYVRYVCGPDSSYADYGIQAQHIAKVDPRGTFGIRPIIRDHADVDRLVTPRVWVDWQETERRLDLLSDIADGIMPVRKRGLVHQWFSPWDQMIHWYGIEKLYSDLVEDPELVHHLVRRFMEISHEVLDRQIELGLLSRSNGNHRVGSGGLGITNELPADDGGPAHPEELWGTAAAQIFSEVSPAMHEEFALQYERPYIERFGLSAYGCCDPLHRKIGILRSIRNLRRISVSPFADLPIAAREIGRDYVLSYKPNPALLAGSSFDESVVRRSLEIVLEQASGCHVELILKDISTVRGEPSRLWRWAAVAMQVVTE